MVFDGGKLRRVRLEMGFSLEDVGRATGLSRQFISMVEAGESTPGLEKFVALNEFFGVRPDFFLINGGD